jgi:pSer/pThr/pTyr-binding forkhead associated (FHA) protein
MHTSPQPAVGKEQVRLILHTSNGQEVFPLHSGRIRIGRSASCDVQLEDESVSHLHCELEVEAGRVIVRDLASTNGTFVDGQQVHEKTIGTGERLQIGGVSFELAPSPRTTWTAEEHWREAAEHPGRCVSHPHAAAAWVCQECHVCLCHACVKQVKLEPNRLVTLCTRCQGICERIGLDPKRLTRPSGYGQGLLRALIYPFGENCLPILLAAIVLEVVEALTPRQMGLAGSLISLVFGAYMLLYLREILLSSTEGEAHPPPLPILDREAAREHVLEGMGIYLVCFGPWTLWRLLTGLGIEAPRSIGACLLVVGAAYFPMALLAVVVCDDLSALNPVRIIVSIWRTAGRYLELCCFVAALTAPLWLEGNRMVGGTPQASWENLIVGVAGMYVTIVCVRAIGWFYFCSKVQLGWS